MPRNKRSSRRPELAWIDVETTGLDPDSYEVVEVAIIRTDAELRELRRYHALMLPRRPWKAEPEALAINGFSEVRWLERGAVSPLTAWRNALPYLEGAALAGHNVHFDAAFATMELRRLGWSPAWYWRRVDTVSIAYRLYLDGVLEKQTLSALAKYCGVPHVRPHEAMSDVETTLECARVLLGMSPAAE